MVCTRSLFIGVILIHFNKYVLGMNSSKALEGYPEGYLADCPGSTRPVDITPRTLKHLGIVIEGKGMLIAQRRRYSYFQAKQMAADPNMDFSKRSMLFVHGFLDSPNFVTGRAMGQMYRQLGYNVMLLDLTRFITVHYPSSVRYMRPAGERTAEMLSNLTAAGMDPATLELVGVSLGSQTIGFIAKNFYRITGRKIGSLVGLDPAGPCFRNLGPNDRLDQSDADFVTVIQTNIDGFGMAAPIGHVNFYVNGGEYQPGDMYWMPCSVLCSHARSFLLWVAALDNPNSFKALKCDSVQHARRHDCYDRLPRETAVLEVNANRNETGIYYLATDSNYPYFLGDRGLLKESVFWKKHLLQWNHEDASDISSQ